MKRISFNVSEKVYDKLKTKLDDDGDSISSAVKTMLYAIVQEPMELSQKEIDKLERVRKRREELEQLEKEIIAPRGIPKTPLLPGGTGKLVERKPDKPVQQKPVQQKPVQQKPVQQKPAPQGSGKAFIKQKPRNNGS